MKERLNQGAEKLIWEKINLARILLPFRLKKKKTKKPLSLIPDKSVQPILGSEKLLRVPEDYLGLHQGKQSRSIFKQQPQSTERKAEIYTVMKEKEVVQI